GDGTLGDGTLGDGTLGDGTLGDGTLGDGPPLAGPLNVNAALESLAWAYGAERAASRLEPGLWLAVMDQLRLLAAAAERFAPGEEEADAETTLLYQLLAGELALVLGSLLPVIKPLRSLRKPAVAALSEGLLAVTDGEGLPPARCLPVWPALLACWTRCRAVAKHSGKRAFEPAAEAQYEWLVRQSIRFARSDGAIALTAGAKIPRRLWEAAFRFGGDDADLAAASLRLRPSLKRVDATREEPPEPSANSEWSGLAVLAGGWKPNTPRLTVAHEGDHMLLEATAGGTVILSGAWPVEVSMEGARVATSSAWEEQCWFSDEDSDYLELAIELANGAKLERQVFLAHDLGVAYLAEMVLSRADEVASLELSTRLTLAETVSLNPEAETREGWLVAGDTRLAGAVPLALPEWRIDHRPGKLTVEDGRLSQTHVAVARNLCSPLLLDFKPTRFAKQRTWRQLAVAESLERVGPDVAVGYRYQSGKDQLLIYRSLAKPGNRTVLGQNYSSEALIGRFLSTGEVDEYFEIETEQH
ncbi:MAG: hypothetical protein AAGB00_11365, partial [Planctomycetota bacterium]